ncbi:MAG: repair protein RecO [Verrucomicrobiota bacterium]
MEKATAILINRYRLTESSLIIHWCSAEGGLFKTVAKGALRPKSAFAGRLDLFVTCEVDYTRSIKSDLHSLKEAHLTEPRMGIRESYLRVLAGTYFCKLVEMVAEKETPLDGVHRLLQLSLDYLNSHDPAMKLLHRFENKLCEELGLGVLEHGGGALLHEVFHRPLPVQRGLIMKELEKQSSKEVLVATKTPTAGES